MIWIIFGHIVATRCLHYVAGHEGRGIVIALQAARGQIAFDLQTEQVSKRSKEKTILHKQLFVEYTLLALTWYIPPPAAPDLAYRI